MKPIIGITTSMEIDQTQYTTNQRNVRAIIRAGGLPMMLPYVLDDMDLAQIAQQIDGLYATGGDDIDPTLFGEEPHPKLGPIIPKRDQFEIELMKKMLDMDKPILGVCRGSQTLNIAAGGDMYQDIYAQMESELLQHSQRAPREHGSHYVDILGNSLLYQLVGQKKIRVNSYHHQANRDVSENYQISALASDGVVEAIESKENTFVLGVQWHPEAMNDEASDKIYLGFIEACKQDV
ncbi:gamma-glutamyl-gamma-aminobutyrate hydrolase family protein [Oceanobacillus senegalensis]|uniref:gamma-glutamyl-gamma-aminobutyrate hydrolase family protein n=1 Tax=Oceanobacillus senegalensis TaxID=1936063 RepID=UPI000A309D7D|nr:gamma-glutamyl-gamma-aminobutyrate hydrolase family protein [Oceanobacillus senegalensis]